MGYPKGAAAIPAGGETPATLEAENVAGMGLRCLRAMFWPVFVAGRGRKWPGRPPESGYSKSTGTKNSGR